MFEAFKVGVTISLTNMVSQGLLLMQRQFGVTNQQAVHLQQSLNKIKLMGLAGAAMGGAGFMGLGMIGRMVKPAAEYAHQLQLMNVSGMKQLEIVKATQAAWEAARVVPTSSVTENLAAIRELRMVFGESGHAMEFMPIVQKVQAVLSNLRGEGAHDEAYTLAKALEMKGAVKSPEQFMGQADAMVKAMIASGGKVGAQDFLSAFKYGRAATSGWNDSFAYTILPTLIQEMKSGGGAGGTGGPGNALMSAYAAVVGGTVPQKALKVWEKIGLLDPSKVEWNKVGSAKGIRPGGIRGSNLFQEDPFQWTQSFLIPALQKAGYTTEKQQKEALQYLFPNRTAGFVMTQFATQAWKFQRDVGLIKGAQGIGAYDQLLKNDPMMAHMALQKQWQSLLAILGFQIMPPLIKGAQILIDLFRSMSAWFREHSTLAKVLMYSFVGLSAALAFGGIVLGLAAAFKGIALAFGLFGSAASIAGLATSLTAFAAGLGVVAAALAGAGIGMLINKGYEAMRGRQSSIGSDVYSLFHQSDGRDVKSSSGSPFIGTKGGAATGRAAGNVYLDGRLVGRHVARGMAQEAGRPMGGSIMFDATMALTPPAFAGAQ